MCADATAGPCLLATVLLKGRPLVSRPRPLRSAAVLAAVGLLVPAAALSPAALAAPSGPAGITTSVDTQPFTNKPAAEAAAEYLVENLEGGEHIGENAGITSDVAFALISTYGPEADVVTPVVDWLEEAAAEYTAGGPIQAAKLLLVAEAAGRDGSDFGGVDLPQVIADGMQENGQYGGFGYAFGQGMAIAALIRAGEPVPEIAYAHLLTYQDPETGAFGYGSGTDFTPDTDASALALLGLVALSTEGPGATEPTLAVRDWLGGVQTDEGYWESYSPVNSTGYVATALDHLGQEDDLATSWMLSQQLTDGGLPNVLDGDTSDVLATAQGALVFGGESLLSVGVDGIDRVRVGEGTQALRVAGSDRYDTAVRISWQFDPGVDAVYVARGDSFPDAIAAAAIAGAQGAPLLFTQPGNLPAATGAELTRLAPDDVHVLGGTAAVSEAVVADISTAAGVEATRVDGDNRYETAATLAGAPGVDAATVYVATGQDYPDALAAAASAGTTSSPVLLVQQGRVPAVTAETLLGLEPEQIVLLGGDSAVSQEVEAQLAEVAEVTRVEGENRYDTARLLAGENGLEEVTVASGETWPDALAASAAAAHGGTPLLLVKSDALPRATETSLLATQPAYAVVVGGVEAIEDSVLTDIESVPTLD